jgi:DNA-binding MarR family transcriptional regulator
MLPRPDLVRQRWAAHNPGLDTSPMEVVALLKRATALIERAIEPLYEGAPLTAPEVDLLIPLRHAEEPCIARRLAEHKGMSRAGISKALTKLEKRGLIERTPSSADRRASLVAVTEAGKAAVDALFPQHLAIEARLLAGLGPDRDRVVDALGLLTDTLERALNAAESTAPASGESDGAESGTGGRR